MVVAAAAGMKPPVAAAAAVVVDMDSEEGGGDLKVLVHMEHDVDFNSLTIFWLYLYLVVLDLYLS